MRRKVSMWIVIALVGALAATTAAAVVLAQRDDGPDGFRVGGPAASGWSHPGLEESGEWQGPVMGSLTGWEHEGQAPVLPWVLFALATGTAVGLLIAWSPWRAQPATATAGPPANGGGSAAREDATQVIAVNGIVPEPVAAPEEDAMGASVADESAIAASAPLEDEGRTDETADADAADDDATRETPPQA